MQIKMMMLVSILVLMFMTGYVVGRFHQIELSKQGMVILPDINQCFP